MTREEALDKIRKVYELVNKGEHGERDAARNRLDMLMEKYGVKLEDLDDDIETMHFYQLHGNSNHEIFVQVAATKGVLKMGFIGTHDNDKKSKELKKILKYIKKPRGTNVVVICSPLKFIEITTAYELHQKSFDEHYEAFFYAFLNENNLLVGKSSNKELTEEQIKMLHRARRMTFGIDRTEVHPQLQQTNQ